MNKNGTLGLIVRNNGFVRMKADIFRPLSHLLILIPPTLKTQVILLFSNRTNEFKL